jgi:hypothetical protein
LGGLGGGGLPGGRMGCGGIGLLVLLVVGYLLLNMLSGGGGSPATDQTQQEPPGQAPAQVFATEPPQVLVRPSRQPAQPPQGTLSAQPTAAPPALSLGPAAAPGQGSVTPGQRWTVLLYEDADDKILDQDIFIDLNEAERVGSSERVNVIAQIDRYRTAGGTAAGARRFYVTKDQDLNRVASKELANLGELNMSDPKSLSDFVTWGVKAYPADKYVLILSDHGMGWPGGWSDASATDQRPAAASSVPLAGALGNQLYLMDLDKVLGEIRQKAVIDKFELIGLDACLMSQLEVYAALAPHARYAVASEETEPALGWAYTAFLTALQRNPDASGAELGRQIVQTYVEDDQRITDDQARAEFMRQGSPMGGLFGGLGAPSSEELARQLGDSITLTALNLDGVPALMQSVNEFAAALQAVPQEKVAQARTYAQSYTSIFGSQVPPSYIDLGHFAAWISRSANNADVTRTATAVQDAIKSAVLAEKHGPKKPGSSGIAIYFPNSQLYRNAVAGPQSYTAIAQRFASQSTWPNFLAFHYTGKRFSADTRAPAVPDRSTTVTAPGAGGVQVGNVQLSATSVTPGNTINMRAQVTGQNIGYVYFFTGYFDKASNSISVADTDYLDAPQTRQLNNVYYPDWGGRTTFTLDFDWEPLMFGISDGQTTAQVLLQPESYGVQPEQAVYTVEGLYTVTGETNRRYAKLYFSNGLLRRVMGFSTDKPDAAGSPWEITPQTGDTFTVLEKWLDLDSSGKVEKEAWQEGKTLTFGSDTFTWKQLDAAAGNYVIGFIVEDMDGNLTPAYAQARVQ